MGHWLTGPASDWGWGANGGGAINGEGLWAVGQQAPLANGVGGDHWGQKPGGGVMAGWPAAPSPDEEVGCDQVWSGQGEGLQEVEWLAPPHIGVGGALRGRVAKGSCCRKLASSLPPIGVRGVTMARRPGGGAAGLLWWGGLIGGGVGLGETKKVFSQPVLD